MKVERTSDGLNVSNGLFGGKAFIPLGSNDLYIVSPKDNYIYVQKYSKDNMMTLVVYTSKGYEKDKRTYSYFFKGFFINEGQVCVRYYDYTAKAWMRARLLGTAGLMSITEDK